MARLRVVFATEPHSTFGRPSLAALLSLEGVSVEGLVVSGPLETASPARRLWRRISPWHPSDPRGLPPFARRGITCATLPGPRALADRLGIPLLASRADPTALAPALARLRPDLLVSVGHETLFPAAILDIPARGAWNVHPTLLPLGAGASPWFWTILRGDPFGITLHRMTAEPDAGPVFLQRGIPSPARPDQAWMISATAVASASLLTESLPAMTREAELPAAPTPIHDPVPSLADLTIAWGQPAERIDSLVRACGLRGALLGPRFPGAAVLEGNPLPEKTRGKVPGTLLGIDADSVTVATATVPYRMTWMRGPSGRLAAGAWASRLGLSPSGVLV